MISTTQGRFFPYWVGIINKLEFEILLEDKVNHFGLSAKDEAKKSLKFTKIEVKT